jgi:hypothetical protein
MVNGHSSLLDPFIPDPDVRERFGTTVRAPARIVMEVASGFDMQSVPAVKAIFWLREKLMGAGRSERRVPQGILDETRALGWGLLAEQPGRFVVCGAACRPWLANVKFVAVPAASFAGYAEPDRVKIAWTLEAEELGSALTRLSQETRALATDEEARRKFTRYWRWARFGIIAIRLLMLPAVRREAERRWAAEQARG